MRDLHFFVHMEMIQCASRMRWQSLMEMHREPLSVLLNLLFIGRRLISVQWSSSTVESNERENVLRRGNLSNQRTLRRKDLKVSFGNSFCWMRYLSCLITPDNRWICTQTYKTQMFHNHCCIWLASQQRIVLIICEYSSQNELFEH